VAKIRAAFHLGNRVINGLAVRPTKRGWTVAAGATLPVPDDNQQDPAPPFKTLARQLKLSGGQPVTLCLAKQQAIIRSVMLPSTDPAELGQMARFEAERHIPFNAERHCVGYHVMRSRGVEGSEVLLGAVDGPVVGRGLDGLTGAGLVPDGITISSTCLVNSLLHQQKEAFTQRTQAILSIGLDSLDLIFLHQGRVLYARSVALDLRGVLEAWIGYRADGGVASPDMAKLALAAHMIDCDKLEEGEGTEAVQRWIDRVAQEIQRTYDFARREMKCPPIEAIVLTGEGAALRNLDRLLAKGTELAVETLNPVGALAGADKQKFPFHGLEYTIVFGALIGGQQVGAYRIDLTPASHYRAMARKALTRRLMLTGALLLATVGLSSYSYLAYKNLRSQTLRDYKAINGTLWPTVTELETMQTKLKIIKTFIEDPNAALTVFESIVQAPVIADSVYLEKIAFVKGESVVIEGRAKTIEDISRLIAYLDGTGHFLPVQRSRQSPSTLESKPVYTFTLECPLKVEGQKEAKEKEAKG
jgi:type IV pilus assembly protein PilM